MANKIEKQFLDTENKGPVRLNKYLSEAGVCSRREADRLPGTLLYIRLLRMC